MGGRSKSQIVGYRYFLGQHFLLCSNAVSLMALRFQDKLAWAGYLSSDTFRVNKQDLFGGQEREGGVSGLVDMMDGRPDQPVNTYLASQLSGATTPAFRFISSLVLRRFYIGNNYYPKSPRIKVTDNQIRTAWEPDLAQFVRESIVENAVIHFVIAPNMDFEIARAPLAARIRAMKGTINSVRVQFVGLLSTTPMIERLNCSDQDYEDIAVWVEGVVSPGGGFSPSVATGQFQGFVSSANPSIVAANPVLIPGQGDGALDKPNSTTPIGQPADKRRMFIMIAGATSFTGGNPAAGIAAVANAESYSLGVGSANPHINSADNTPQDGIPNNLDTPAKLEEALTNVFTSWTDINPVHIFYDLVTAAPDRTNINTNLIGDSFLTAAQQLVNENFGLSFYWRSASDPSVLQRKVEDHIDGVMYFSRRTGKYEIALIREDYDVNDLPVFDSTNVAEWKDDISRELEESLINQLTLTYRKTRNGEKKSVTLSNAVAIRKAGRVKPQTVDYDGIYDDDLAVKVCARDLSARSRPKWSGTIVAANAPADINLGSVFVVNNPRLGMNNVIARVAQIDRGTQDNRRVTIEFIEDKFSLGETVELELITQDAPSVGPEPSEERLVEEAPYYLLVEEQGQAETDLQLNDEPSLGYLQTTGEKPTGFHIDATVFANLASAGWNEATVTSFCPVKDTAEDLGVSPLETTVEITDTLGIEGVRVGSLALMGNEYVRIDSVTTTAPFTLTIGRGCLDTLPEAHASGTTILFFHDFADSSGDEYVAGDSVDVKLLTRTGAGQLLLDDAPTDNVVFNSRANRPYPVGNLRLNAMYAFDNIPDGTLQLTWAHRDRTIQTTPIINDYADGNIGPETGVSYTVTVYSENDAETNLGNIETSSVGTDTSYTVVATSIEDMRPASATKITFSVEAARSSVANRVSSKIKVGAFARPRNFMAMVTS